MEMSTGSRMKRKLNVEDVPTPHTPVPTDKISSGTFDALGLDVRLLKAVAHEKYSNPTPVQSQAIPLALEGKDILGESISRTTSLKVSSLICTARAKTGSGKTAAYILPVLEAILRRKTVS